MIIRILTLVIFGLFLTACDVSQDTRDRRAVDNQQAIYSTSQPVPKFKWSIERHLVAELYRARNLKAATHSVWRGETSVVEGDCPSMGYGIPYDTSLTNPLKRIPTHGGIIEQAEPNGIYASKNTAATWVLCVDGNGDINPLYVESKVTSYPYPVTVDYELNRVYPIKGAAASVTISTDIQEPEEIFINTDDGLGSYDDIPDLQ